MKTPVLWILTADHQHARMFTTEGGGGRLHPVEGFAQETHLPASHEAGSHPPDTGFASRGGPRHGYPARTTPHAQAGLAFLDRVAAAVVDAWEHRAFERLVLAAPPKALGELRARLPDGLRDCLAGELALDLAQAPVAEVETHLRHLLRP